jgi:endonuclease/exonuclease/phosphatase family metal-dependent hydrolase
VEQFSHSAPVDTWAALAGVSFFWGSLPLLYALFQTESDSGKPLFALGLLFGWGADTLLRGLTVTLDLSWIIAPWANLVLVVLAAAYTVLLWEFTSPTGSQQEMSTTAGLSLLGLGPLFFIQWQYFQNQGWTDTLTGWTPAAALAWLTLANAAAMGTAVYAIRRDWLPSPAWSFLPGLALTGSLLLIETPGWVFALALLVGILSAGLLLVNLAGAQGRRSLGLVFGLSLLLATGLVSLYYISFLVPALPFLRTSLAPIAAVGLTLCSLTANRLQRPAKLSPGLAPFAWSALLMVAPLAMYAAELPRRPPFRPDEETLRVMTYNIHAGFGLDARLDIAAVAQVIEDSGAEVVGLQELSRGWLISGGTDLLPLFARRLEMPAAMYGPAADPIGGNGLLSQRAFLTGGYESLPHLDGLVGRCYVWGQLEWPGDESMLIMVTHLDSERSDIRLAQIQALLDGWGGRSQTILMGDFNAQPGSQEIQTILAAGFRDAWTEAGQPERPRIDWIFITPDLDVQDVVMIESPASDHPAFAATILPEP